MNKRILILPVLLGLAAVAWWVTRDTEAAEGLRASGTVEATEADLGFQLPGRLERVAVREGDVVREGQELAALDLAEPTAAADAARAQLAGAEARLAELRRGARPAELAQAEAGARSASHRALDAGRDAERTRRLFEGGAVSRQALDKAETALEVAEAARVQAEEALALVREGPRRETIDAQVAAVAQARANVDRALAALTHGTIAAPFPGRVTLRHREPGETVPVGAPVLTLLDPNDRWVRIYVREDRIGAVQVGMSASIVSDTYPDRTYRGEVVYIGNEAEFTPRNVQTEEERTKLVYPVKVRILGDEGFELKPGIPADVTLGTSGA